MTELPEGERTGQWPYEDGDDTPQTHPRYRCEVARVVTVRDAAICPHHKHEGGDGAHHP